MVGRKAAAILQQDFSDRNRVEHNRNRVLILASQSPRRVQLLQQLGLSFVQESACVSETVGRHPAETVCTLAREKAKAVLRRHAGENVLVLAADTVVCLDGRIFGKPADEAEAGAMLRALSGRTHQVYTGVCLCDAGKILTEYESTDVTFAPLTEEQILRYVQSGEAADKAGAYGIQGRAAAFVERVNGCYSNVVGLPLHRTVQMLEDFGVYI